MSQEDRIPEDSKVIIEKFSKVVQNPSDVDTLWIFVKDYLTYLENKTHMVLPLIDKDSKETLIVTIKNKSNKDIPWGVYSCFLTISNLGSDIAQKEQLDDTDRYYIMYVMLAFDGDSPVFQFTQLLQNLQAQDENTLKVYEALNEKFLKASEKYNQPPVKSKKKNPLNKTICKVAGKDIKGLHILIGLSILIALIAIAVLYFKKAPSTNTIELSNDFGSSSGSVIGKYSSDVSSVYSG